MVLLPEVFWSLAVFFSPERLLNFDSSCFFGYLIPKNGTFWTFSFINALVLTDLFWPTLLILLLEEEVLVLD